MNCVSSSTAQLKSLSVSAYHGWGFAASCWQGWRQIFAQQGCVLQTVDRGYFTDNAGSPSPLPNNNEIGNCNLILTHSYGLHLCPIDHLKQADVLVIFAGFAEFHPCHPRVRNHSRRILQQMIQRFKTHPQLVLSQFKSNCYHPIDWHGTITDRLNVERLLQDLEALNSASIDLAPLQTIPNIILLHGLCDRITSPVVGQELAQLLPQNSQYIEIEDAGHALPFTHLETCWSILQPRLATQLQRRW